MNLSYISTSHLSDPSLQIQTDNEKIIELINTIFSGEYGIDAELMYELNCYGCDKHFFNLGGYFSATCKKCEEGFCGQCIGENNLCFKCLEQIKLDNKEKYLSQINEFKQNFQIRYYINVPLEEYDDVRECGGHWDDTVKCWYAPSKTHELCDLYEPSEFETLCKAL